MLSSNKHLFVKFQITPYKYNFSELVDMLLILGECHGNNSEAVRVYRERYPNRQIPHRQTFSSIERRLRETGKLEPGLHDAGTVQLEENIFNNFSLNV